jgi:hypothetical protein
MSQIPILSKKDAQVKLDDGAYSARTILEIVGKPKEHVEETLQTYITKIAEDIRYGVTSVSTEEAIAVEESEGLFSTFAEIEFVTKDYTELMNFVVDYMPASIEIIEPSSVQLQAGNLSDMLTELVGRLHSIDMEFKKAAARNQILSQSVDILTKNAILILLQRGPRTKEEIAKVVGINETQIGHFLDALVADERLVFDADKKVYSKK